MQQLELERDMALEAWWGKKYHSSQHHPWPGHLPSLPTQPHIKKWVLIPCLGSHTAAILLCSQWKQSQGYPHHGGVTSQKSMQDRGYQCGHLWRMQCAKHPPPPKINRGLGSPLKRSGWQGSWIRRKGLLLIWSCHSHPCFFKEQETHPVCSGNGDYCQGVCRGARKTESTEYGWCVLLSQLKGDVKCHLRCLCCAVQSLRHQLFPSKALPSGCFGGTLSHRFSCHCQWSCSMLLSSLWLWPPMASRILSRSSLHHCCSPLCSLMVGTSVLPNVFLEEGVFLQVTLSLSVMLGHLGGWWDRDWLPIYAYFKGLAIAVSVSTQFGSEILEDGFGRV